MSGTWLDPEKSLERSVKFCHWTATAPAGRRRHETAAPARGLRWVSLHSDRLSRRSPSSRRYSEGRAAHWLLLLAADRVDVVEGTLASFLTRHPDNPITETGVLSEFTHHGLSSRLRGKRVDRLHHPLDPVLVAAPWVLAAGVAYLALRRVADRTKT
ncbi:hypothetical protein PSN01_03189 [Micromonospora saelicesensis]|nr:hypothetical protein PSN01_03189 [Micromonospora saelicesensis]